MKFDKDGVPARRFKYGLSYDTILRDADAQETRLKTEPDFSGDPLTIYVKRIDPDKPRSAPAVNSKYRKVVLTPERINAEEVEGFPTPPQKILWAVDVYTPQYRRNTFGNTAVFSAEELAATALPLALELLLDFIDAEYALRHFTNADYTG